MRLGLPNVITLVCLFDIGFAASVEVAVLRSLMSSFVLGTFLSPAFALSFFGALASAVVMGMVYKLARKIRNASLSIVGISLLGALTHNLAQIIFVYLLLIRRKEIFLLLPWLGLSAVVMGWFNGLVAAGVCRKLEEPTEEAAGREKPAVNEGLFSHPVYVSTTSPLYFMTAQAKIISVTCIALSVLFFQNAYLYLGIFILFLAAAQFSGVSVIRMLAGLRKMFFFVFSAFIVPLFFNTGGKTLIEFGFLKITRGGFNMGVFFAFRIVLLALMSSCLVKTTSPGNSSTL